MSVVEIRNICASSGIANFASDKPSLRRDEWTILNRDS